MSVQNCTLGPRTQIELMRRDTTRLARETAIEEIATEVLVCRPVLEHVVDRREDGGDSDATIAILGCAVWQWPRIRAVGEPMPLRPDSCTLTFLTATFRIRGRV
jgi:hypothetical protein